MQTPEGKDAIQLFKKYLNDKGSVSKEELQGAVDAAVYVAEAAVYARASANADNASDIAYCDKAAKHWVSKYEELAQKEDSHENT